MRQLKSTDIPKLRSWILKKKQGGKCAICGAIPERPCLDHHHVKKIKGTGRIRGVLCNKCNVFIAKSENNCLRYGISQTDLPKILRSMAEYLERNQYPYIHPSEKPSVQILTRRSYDKLQRAYTGRAKFPAYRTIKRGKTVRNAQTLTKKLETLFAQYKIKPEFYK